MRKFGRLERKKAIATLVAVVSCAGLLASCSSADPWAEPVYLQNLYVFDGAAWNQITTNGGGGGLGDVVGPAASTDNAIARYNLLTGKLIQNSGVTIDDFDNLDTNGGDLTGFDIWADNDVNITNDLDVTDDADIGGDLTITGTVDGVNVSAHAARHAVGGTDTVFPADPGADKYLMWDDVPGNLSWESAGGGDYIYQRFFKTGRYHSTAINHLSFAGSSYSKDYIYAVPYINGKAVTITRMAFHLRSISASAKARIGIYADSGSIAPGALVIDCGEVDCSVATGIKETTGLSVNLSAQTLYWLVYTSNDSSIQVTNDAAASIPNILGLTTTTLDATYPNHVSISSAYGALPNPCPAITFYSKFDPPRICVYY